MLRWFSKRKPVNPLTTDIHSHLLPGLDDGVKSLEESEAVIRYFLKLGYTKIITTPHVMQDHFRNTSNDIRAKLKELKEYLHSKNISITMEAAAEYYLDEHFLYQIETNQDLLTFGNRYLLFETNFLSEPLNLKEFIFTASTKGFKLVMAHPERYLYLHNNLNKVQDLLDRGVLFQINMSSLIGYYSKPVQLLAQKLIDKSWVHMLGSDCHHIQHAELMEEVQRSRYFQKILTLPLLNNSL